VAAVGPTTTRPPDAPPAPPPPRRRGDVAAALALGLGGAVVLAGSGSLVWGALRAAAAVALGLGLAGLQTTGRGRLADWTGVVVGLLALPAAGVVAGERLGAGRTVVGAAAVLAAAGAGLLLVLGAVRRIRAARGWRRLLAIPVALAAAQLVAVPVALAVLVTNTSAQPLGEETPQDRGLTYVDVTLTTRDGTDLAAWYVPGTSGSAVLLLHGSGCTRADALDHAAALADLGHGVLMVDARGHGASDGTAMALGWHGAEDLVAAVDWLDERPDAEADRIGAVGLSMGGEEALTLAARDPRVRVVVAEGAGVRVPGDVREPGWFPHLVDTLTYGLTDLLTAAAPPEPLPDVVAALRPDQRALLIAGEGEGTQAAWYATAAPDRVTVWDVPGAGHTRALATHPDQWSARVGAALADATGEEAEDRQ